MVPAESFFHNKLANQLDNPYVFAQYATMLSEQGDYGAFESLIGQVSSLRLRNNRENHFLKVYLGLLAATRDRYASLLQLRDAEEALRMLMVDVDDGLTLVSRTTLRCRERDSFICCLTKGFSHSSTIRRCSIFLSLL